MNNIDLLPWRERKRNRQKKMFLLKLFFSTLIITLIGIIHIMQQQQHLDNQLSQFSKNKKILKKIQKQTEITQTKIKRNHQATAIKKQGEKLSQWLYHIAHALPQNASLISLQYDQKTLEIIGVVSTDMDLEAYQKILSALPGISNTYVNEIKPAQEKKGLEFSITLRLAL